MLFGTRVYIIPNINNMETVADLRGPEEVPPERNPADSLAGSGLRARLRLEQRLLRFKDGSGFWWAKVSSVIISVINAVRILFPDAIFCIYLRALWYCPGAYSRSDTNTTKRALFYAHNNFLTTT